MDLVVWVVKSAARFVYESYTKTGRIGWGVKTMNEFANLRDKLRMMGLDTSAVDEELDGTLVQLIKNASVMLRGEPTIEVNGEEMSIGFAFRDRYIEESKRGVLVHLGEQDGERDDQK